MASGLPHPQWNGADVTGAGRRSRGRARVLRGARPAVGRARAGGHGVGRRPPAVPHAADGRCAARTSGRRPTCTASTLRAAGPADIEPVLAVDATAFGSIRGCSARGPSRTSTRRRITVALAALEGEPVGTAYTLRSDGAAGPRRAPRRRRGRSSAARRRGDRRRDELLAARARVRRRRPPRAPAPRHGRRRTRLHPARILATPGRWTSTSIFEPARRARRTSTAAG